MVWSENLYLGISHIRNYNGIVLFVFYIKVGTAVLGVDKKKSDSSARPPPTDGVDAKIIHCANFATDKVVKPLKMLKQLFYTSISFKHVQQNKIQCIYKLFYPILLVQESTARNKYPVKYQNPKFQLMTSLERMFIVSDFLFYHVHSDHWGKLATYFSFKLKNFQYEQLYSNFADD